MGQNFILKKEFLDQFQKSLWWRQDGAKDFEQLARIPAFEKSLVIEIGAGPTGLSRRILKSNPAKLISIEIDPRFIPLLTVHTLPVHVWNSSNLSILLMIGLEIC